MCEFGKGGSRLASIWSGWVNASVYTYAEVSCLLAISSTGCFLAAIAQNCYILTIVPTIQVEMGLTSVVVRILLM